MGNNDNLIRFGRRQMEKLPSPDTPKFLSSLYEDYHIRPRSAYPKLSFFLESTPDYIEDPQYCQGKFKDYLFMIKKNSFGILYWHYDEGLFFDDNEHLEIIPCYYDEIEKCVSDVGDVYFIGYKDGTRTYYDTKGRVLPPSPDIPAFLNTRLSNYHFRPRSAYPKLSFVFFESKPDYIEDPQFNQGEFKNYLFMMKKDRFGILYWHYEWGFFYDDNENRQIVSCEYDKIDKCKSDAGDIYFIAYKGTIRTFFDKNGNVLR